MAYMSREPTTTGKLYMLRCIIAMAHADGIVDDLERAYISGIMNHIPLSDEQRRTLETDLDVAQNVGDLLPYINEPKFRAQISYFARLMAYKDGVLHPSEKDLLDKLESYATNNANIELLRPEIRKAVSQEMALHDIEIDKNRAVRGKHFIPWFQIIDEIFLAMGIDLLRD